MPRTLRITGCEESHEHSPECGAWYEPAEIPSGWNTQGWLSIWGPSGEEFLVPPGVLDRLHRIGRYQASFYW